MSRNNQKVKVCTKVPLDIHIRLQAICGAGRQYPSIERFLLRATEKALGEATRGTASAKPYDQEYAPRNDAEWRWTYGLMRWLRFHRKRPYPALRLFLAELFKVDPAA